MMHPSTQLKVAQNLDYHVRMFQHYDEQCKLANKSLEEVQQTEHEAQTAEGPQQDEVSRGQEEIIEAKAVQDLSESEKIRDLHREVAEQLRDILNNEPVPAVPISVQRESHPIQRDSRPAMQNVSPNNPQSPLALSSSRIGRG
jgi:hypothetical protein